MYAQLLALTCEGFWYRRHDDPARLGEAESLLQPREPARELHYLGLPLVDGDAERRAQGAGGVEEPPEGILVERYEVGIIHVSARCLDSAPTFAEVVERGRYGDGQRLVRFASQTEPDPAVRLYLKAHELDGRGVCERPPHEVECRPVVDCPEVVGEVHEQDIALRSVSAVMLGELPLQSHEGVVRAAASHVGGAPGRERRPHRRGHDRPRDRFLYHAFGEPRRGYRPVLPAFDDVEPDEALADVVARQEVPACVERVAQGVDHVALDTCLPADALGGVACRLVDVVEAGGIGDGEGRAALRPVRGPLRIAPGSPGLSALIAIHDGIPRGLRLWAPAFPGRLQRSNETASSAEARGHARSGLPSQRDASLRARARTSALPSSCARSPTHGRGCLASMSNPTRGRIQSFVASL